MEDYSFTCPRCSSDKMAWEIYAKDTLPYKLIMLYCHDCDYLGVSYLKDNLKIEDFSDLTNLPDDDPLVARFLGENLN